MIWLAMVCLFQFMRNSVTFIDQAAELGHAHYLARGELVSVAVPGFQEIVPGADTQDCNVSRTLSEFFRDDVD